jgi:hypothetical protein
MTADQRGEKRRGPMIKRKGFLEGGKSGRVVYDEHHPEDDKQITPQSGYP